MLKKLENFLALLEVPVIHVIQGYKLQGQPQGTRDSNLN